MTAPTQVAVPGVMVAITTYGSITFETVSALMEMRSFCEGQNLKPVWNFVPGTLVDRARNQAVVQFLAQPGLGWLCFVDGDAVFKPDALARLLVWAYGEGK